MPWKLYDFIDRRGRNLVTEWLTREVHHQETRARIKMKLQILMVAGPELPPNLITPTRERHIREIVVNTKFGAFRIFACRGPSDPHSELTLLCGGQEKDRKYVRLTPSNAERYRQELLEDINERRRTHEYFKGLLGGP